MKDTKIRWAEHTWNPVYGCTKISPGCDNCYAEVIANKFKHNPGPDPFAPTYKPKRLGDPAKWLRTGGPSRIFCNSMSDLFHVDFSDDQIAEVVNVMLDTPQHDYLLLTKRPQRMAKWFLDWLDNTGRDEVPAQIWLGTSIENDRYTFRADHLRRIPVPVRFLSVEPMLGPVPSLNVEGLQWVIVGGESGPGYRPMDHEWARDVRDMCQGDGGPAFYFKQSAAPRTEMGITLDDEIWEQYPLAHPADHQGDRVVGRWTGRHATETAVAVPHPKGQEVLL